MVLVTAGEDRTALRAADELAITLEPCTPPLGKPEDASPEPTPACLPSAALREAKAMGRLALPITCSFLLQLGLGLVNDVAAGRLGVAELDGAGVGRLFANITGLYVILGLVTGLDTLATQAHGAQCFHLVGLSAQRAALITGLCCLPVIALWWAVEPLLCYLGQDPRVAHLASQYLRIVSPGLYPFVIFEIIKKYLQVQGIVWPILCILLATLLFHAVATYLLTWPLGLGFFGGPLALTLSWTFMMALGLLYVFYSQCLPKRLRGSDPLQCWGGWSSSALREWGAFLRLGIPSTAQLCLDWWAFEVLSFEAGVLGVSALAASNINLQLLCFIFMVPFGVQIAASIRVGHHLGANAPAAARLATRTAVGGIVVLSGLMGVALLWLQPLWARLYTTDPEALQISSQLLLLVTLVSSVDCVQSVIGAVLRAAGLQAWGASINFVAQWCVGLPLSTMAAFRWGFGLHGLWMGLLCAVCVELVLGTVALGCANWGRLAAAAQGRTQPQPPAPGEV
eukprot:EG_transcript_9954